MNWEDFDHNALISKTFQEQLGKAYEAFWDKKQLGYDTEGRRVRTNLDRKRPKEYREQILREALHKKSLIENHLNDERRKKD